MDEKLIEKLLEILVLNYSDGNKSKADKKEWSHPLKGKPVIVRACDAGCHFGYLEHFEGRVVTLSRTRRMHCWWSKKEMTPSAVAAYGLNESKSELRIQNELPLIIIQDSCEIIPCTTECVESFSRVKPYDEQ